LLYCGIFSVVTLHGWYTGLLAKVGLSDYTSCSLHRRDGFVKVGFARFFLCPRIGRCNRYYRKRTNPSGCEAGSSKVVTMSELVIDRVQAFLQSLLPSMKLDLFDVQYLRDDKGWVLRVFIESETGVTLDHCSLVSRELGRYLDVEDLVDHAYSLEVSSPGLERPLRSTDDFHRYCGKKARVKVHNAIDGEKVFEGVIEEVVDGLINLTLEDGRSIMFSFEKINKARLAI
jgi:ribosome maturation factor RimP